MPSTKTVSQKSSMTLIQMTNRVKASTFVELSEHIYQTTRQIAAEPKVTNVDVFYHYDSPDFIMAFQQASRQKSAEGIER